MSYNKPAESESHKLHTMNQPIQSEEKQPAETCPLACQEQPVENLVKHVVAYAKENPGTVALCCFGLGFIVGWKLKPW